MVDVRSLTPNPRNPNHHPDAQIEAIAYIIQANGWRLPITVSNRSGFIVRGHGRLLAAKHLKLKQVPVDYQDYENEAREWEDLIADNTIPELSEMNRKEIAAIIKEIPDVSFLAAGLNEQQMEPFMNLEPVDGPHKGPKEPLPPEARAINSFRATDAQAGTIQRAIDRVRDRENDAISDGRALELIAADFLGGS